MNDALESIRHSRLIEINAEAGSRAQLESRHGEVWDTYELARDFDVIGFAAPYVVVVRRADGVKGSMEFQHHPRLYFNWKAYRE
jgi:hypothetical protein